MKINILTGLYQNRINLTGGVFIYERLKYLHDMGIPFEIWIIKNEYSFVIRCVYRWIKSRAPDESVTPWELDETQHIIPIKVTILKLLLRSLFPRYYYNTVINHLEKKITLDESSILHAHWVYPHGYIAANIAKKHHLPCVVTAHGSDIHTRPQINQIVKRYTLETLNNADKVIFVSQSLLDFAIGLGYSGENAVVISNGVDSREFFPITKEKALIKTGWKQTCKYVVGFVGRLIPVKRADKFVEIFLQIQRKISDVEFIVVGDGDLKEAIHTECNEHGLQVTFTGELPHEDIGSWMNLFDVMILPSRNESWGCVIIEAYACGIPVVGSANGGIPDALGGLCPVVSSGWEFEKRFADAVCDVLTGKIVVDYKRLISWALEHTWEKCVDKEIEVYNKLLE